MVLITAIINTAVMAYACHDIDPDQVRTGFYPFMQMLTAAVCGAFLTGDLFNLFVFFEVLLIASYGLLLLGGILHIMMGSRQTYRTQESLGRVQENGRFAIHTLSEHIRLAGYRADWLW